MDTGYLMTLDDKRTIGGRLQASSIPTEFVTLDGIPVEVYFSLYSGVNRLGLDLTYDLARAGASYIAGNMIPEHQMEHLRAGLEEIADRKLKERWRSDADPILSWTYRLLQAKQINHRQAALIASRLLGKSITTDCWRQRVQRWATARSLPPVALHRRRPRQSEK
jgi:hypothetical protein